ncbi:hypothetical protein MPP7335_00977 [Mycolicibacterium parafortuitum]|uniref:Uncharacterized protein n=1 Tax=Mycolicibacterium parafortuitum TaxID=39692 RepID=A0A375YDM8_MYCPF|nr:hypothetical protein MPP7335_00977 [Mycolicibacterium parafortuitum]
MLADVVVVPHDLASDCQARQHHKDQHGRGDDHAPTRRGARWGFLGLRHNTFGGVAFRIERRRAACRGVRRGRLVVVAGHRARQDRLGLAVVVVDDVGHHHGDVVGTAAAQGQFDEAVGALGDIGDLQRLGDGVLADRVGEPVRAQQVAVAGAGLPHDQRRLDLVAGQRAHDQRPLRMAVGLLGGDPALVDQGLDERVVLGDLGEFAVAQQVAAGVADVHQPEPVAGEQDRRQRGAHALELGVLLDVRGDRGVAVAHRGVELTEQVSAGLVVVEVCQRGDHQLRGDLTCGVAAHAVGQRQQPGPRVDGVLVVGAHQPPVATGCISKNECHGRNSITVLPIRTGVPIGTRTAVVTFALSRYVPLVDPRSSTYHSGPRGESRAWRVEA